MTKQTLNKIYFIFIVLALIACIPMANSYRRSKFNFYIDLVNGSYIYHIDTNCSNITNKNSIQEVKIFFLEMNSAKACKECNLSYTIINK